MANCTGFHQFHLYRVYIFSLLCFFFVLLGYLVQAVFCVCSSKREYVCSL